MSLIFLAYANTSIAPLPSLSKEDQFVYETLINRSSKGHFKIHRDSNATLDSILNSLQVFKREVEIFSFSGHAGSTYLLTESGRGHAKGLAELLEECPNLKLILLNGCSTVGQVKKLLSLKNHPIVIATHAPVEDETAVTFAHYFFRTLSEQYSTLHEAYQTALSAVRFKHEEYERFDLMRLADLFDTDETDDSHLNLWGIFTPESSQYQLNWRLPLQSALSNTNKFEVNSILIEQLLQGLANYNPILEEILIKEENGEEVSMVKKRRSILESLPHPISEHLRKLLVSSVNDSSQLFYDQFSIERLNQIYVAYNSIIEWPTYILLAQLWDSIINKKHEFKINEVQKKRIKDFLINSSETRISTFYFELLSTLTELLATNTTPLFVEEISSVFSDPKEIEPLQNAIQFFERMSDLSGLTKELIDELCMVGEEKLAEIISRFGFFTNYTLVSVKTIEVDKTRTQFQPEFRHQWIELIQQFVGLETMQFTSKDIIDNASVHLRKGEPPNYQYLNLSPFIIDQNALKKAAQIAKLLYFERYDKATNGCLYKHAYKPNDGFIVANDSTLKNNRKSIANRVLWITWQQMDSFSELLFNCKLKEL